MDVTAAMRNHSSFVNIRFDSVARKLQNKKQTSRHQIIKSKFRCNKQRSFWLNPVIRTVVWEMFSTQVKEKKKLLTMQ